MYEDLARPWEPHGEADLLDLLAVAVQDPRVDELLTRHRVWVAAATATLTARVPADLADPTAAVDHLVRYARAAAGARALRTEGIAGLVDAIDRALATATPPNDVWRAGARLAAVAELHPAARRWADLARQVRDPIDDEVLDRWCAGDLHPEASGHLVGWVSAAGATTWRRWLGRPDRGSWECLAARTGLAARSGDSDDRVGLLAALDGQVWADVEALATRFETGADPEDLDEERIALVLRARATLAASAPSPDPLAKLIAALDERWAPLEPATWVLDDTQWAACSEGLIRPEPGSWWGSRVGPGVVSERAVEQALAQLGQSSGDG